MVRHGDGVVVVQRRRSQGVDHFAVHVPATCNHLSQQIRQLFELDQDLV
jgi:hypothetical protein